MPDTTTVPAWLAEAEADYQRARNAQAHSERQRAEQHAMRINDHLARLGIEPEESASVSPVGSLSPALLVGPDFENELNGVSATFRFREDPGSGEVVLLVADWEAPRDIRQGPILRRIGDVVEARHMLPKAPAKPKPNFKAIAERSITALGSRYVSDDGTEIADALKGLTAAVLHLANVTAWAPGRQ